MPLGSPAKRRRPLPGIIARLCTGLTVLFVSVSAANPAGATELHVYATSLTLRAAADTSAPRTARLTFGDSARQIETGPHAQIGTITAPVATDSNGDPFIFDENNWQMIDVRPHGNGVLISYPERAD